MVQSIDYIKECITQTIANQEHNDTENEVLIDSLIVDYKINTIDAATSNITLLNFNKINEYYNKGYCIFRDINNRICYAINNLALIREKHLELAPDILIYLIRKNDLLQLIELNFSAHNTNHAINHLDEVLPNASAKNINYPKMLCGFGIIFFATLSLFVNIFHAVNNFIYLLQNSLKIILFTKGKSKKTHSPIAPIDNNLPIYSILIPLYHEEFKVKSILQAMDNMNYPKDKLDVKLIIEEDDFLTARAIAVLELPSYVHIIKVPYSLPRTKPKALNYAMAYVKGDLLTIYDAEDEPDPDQLLKAIYAFDTLPDYIACVQAKLNFYNANTNFLTLLFSVEYSLWFEYLLKGLSLLDLPVTLGGTSNHFKVDKLREVGYWDAYNVTEDADLGLRLYLHGYKVHLIDSTTLEEAPTSISVWMAQRSRWIKGFLQTFYIFIKTKKDLCKFGFIKILTVYIFVGMSTYSFLCLPWMFLVLTLDIPPIIYYICMLNGSFSFSYMYIVGYFVLARNKSAGENLSLREWLTLLCWPFYFILHTIASYRAIGEALIAPFEWNKTPHGQKENYLED